jgi:hypothetical protein
MSKLNAQMQALGVHVKTAKDRGKQLFDELHGVGQQNAKIVELSNNFQALGGSVQKSLEKWNLEQRVQGIMGVVSGISALGAAVQAFKNVGNIWDNDDLSTGEKIF